MEDRKEVQKGFYVNQLQKKQGEEMKKPNEDTEDYYDADNDDDTDEREQEREEEEEDDDDDDIEGRMRMRKRKKK